MKKLNTLRKLWEDFGNVSINDKEEIEENFLHFKIGTNRFDVWHWFDEQCPNNLHDDIMFIKYKCLQHNLGE